MKRSCAVLVFLTFLTPTVFAQEVVNETTSDGRLAPLLEGMGDLNYKVTTDNEMAQRFFNQGLTLSYAFNHEEAERSFREAARLDPDLAMAYWGIALVLGPNINSPMKPDAWAPAWEAIEKAAKLSMQARGNERVLIRSLYERYQEEPMDDRSKLDEKYADKMRDAMKQFPEDLEIATLTAEALMDLHPWNYWQKNGEPQEWTPEILKILDGVLDIDSTHAGANHFYIHAVEASMEPEKGLPSAKQLEVVVPGAGHLVHMPSHIYIRTGRYHEGSLANERAVESDNQYVAQCRAQGIYELGYVPHNYHFLWATATLEGASEKAIQAGLKTSELVDRDMMRQPGFGTLQHYYVIPLYAYVRFAKWDEILKYTKPDDDLIYPIGIWHYARGMAYARTGEIEKASAELDIVSDIAKNPALRDVTIWNINATNSLMKIAGLALAGEILAAKDHYDVAIQQLERAIEIEDSLAYNEPPDWFFPVRHSLGAVLLAAGRPADAEKVYRADLRMFPNNGWSLFGLWKSLEAQDKTAEAKDVEQLYKDAFRRADVSITASRM